MERQEPKRGRIGEREVSEACVTQDLRHPFTERSTVTRDTVRGEEPRRSGTTDMATDEFGLRAAFLAHSGELVGFARRALGDPQLAEEAAQETFVRAWRYRERFDPSLGSMRTWLFAIERRLVIDLARARSIRRTEPLPPDTAEVEDAIALAMQAWQVEEAIRRLRDEHRHVLVEIYYRGHPSRSVADELGVPDGTVRSRLFYALKALKLVLEEMGWEE
jgi:RNA polymerase sigma-70 factor (ECF subfamily)